MNTTDAANINELWARLLVEELVRNGACRFFLSPGSRNTPLSLAAAGHAEATCSVHFDERGAAFMALGWAKAAGRPAVLVCTSGSATANYWPAVVEASMTRVPLILLTADRPPELLDCGANQAIDQNRLYGGYVRWACVLPCPDEQVPPQTLLTTVDQAVYRATTAHAGPVHLDCMFREPLAPTPDPVPEAYGIDIQAWADASEPYTQWHPPDAGLSQEQRRFVLDKMGAAERGLIVVGQLRDKDEIEAVRGLVDALDWPVLPDVASGLRTGGGPENVIHHYDQLLLSPRMREALRPDFVLHIGGAVTSKRLGEHLAALRPEYMRVAGHPLRQDPHHQVTHRFEEPAASFCRWLAPAAAGLAARNWAGPLAEASRSLSAVLDAWLEQTDGLTEIGVARHVSRVRPEDAVLFLGNSMPIRDMDMYAAHDGPCGLVAANRGASGIDGNVATAAGYAEALGQPVIAVLGDLALLHDLNSLALLRKPGASVVLIVINNDGGGIFSFLPIADYPEHFERCFGTSHGLGFEQAAAMFGLRYVAPGSLAAFAAACGEAIEATESTLIEVHTNRETNKAQHMDMTQRVSKYLEED